MKTRYALPLVALVALAALATGCSIPDYQLDFDASVSSLDSNPVVVNYHLTNSGKKELKSAKVNIEVDAIPLAGGSATGSAWTSESNTDVGETVSGSVSVSLSGSPTFSSPIAYMSSAAWDEDSNSIF